MYSYEALVRINCGEVFYPEAVLVNKYQSGTIAALHIVITFLWWKNSLRQGSMVYWFTGAAICHQIYVVILKDIFRLTNLAKLTNKRHFMKRELFQRMPNFSGTAVEVWAWINKFIPHFTRHAITYPCWN